MVSLKLALDSSWIESRGDDALVLVPSMKLSREYNITSLALPIQPIRAVSPPLGTILECVEFESAEQVCIRGGVHNADGPFRGRLGGGYESG